jgi:hypothetical protein
MDTTSRRHGKTDRAVAASNPVVKPAAELIGFYAELNAECAECEFPASQEKFEARNPKQIRMTQCPKLLKKPLATETV